MDVDEVRRRVAGVAEHAKRVGDNEAAHCDEDALYIEVLRAVAQGAPNAAELAAEALHARDLDFTRWYA
ncbi:hypothetical protein GCM10023224_05470 [Streptomonospora halophila]|uniref:Uncharacterized protein n=1 Tax=Streptomonospora halophila TaxID=427369 RepID=A0ABP9G5N2_9ACTN